MFFGMSKHRGETLPKTFCLYGDHQWICEEFNSLKIKYELDRMAEEYYVHAKLTATQYKELICRAKRLNKAVRRLKTLERAYQKFSIT